MLKKILFSMVFIFLSACAPYTTIHTSRNPTTPAQPFKKVFIDAQGFSAPAKLDAEWAFKRKFSQLTLTEVLLDSDLFLNPIVQDEKNKRLAKEGVDGVLVIKFVNQYTSQTYYPPQQTTEVRKDAKGNARVITSNSGGYYLDNITTNHELTLVDFKTGKPVWVGFAETSGTGGVQKSLAEETILKLNKAGFLQVRKK